jgi:hypothetical protein
MAFLNFLKLPRWLAPVLVIALIAGVVIANHFLKPPPVQAHAVSCPNIQAGCTVQVAERTLTLGMRGTLKVLTPFEVWLIAPGSKTVQASFTMEGMDMGFNLYTLRPGADGVFRTQVTLPVCVTGRRDWVMTLYLDDLVVTTPFVTDL